MKNNILLQYTEFYSTQHYSLLRLVAIGLQKTAGVLPCGLRRSQGFAMGRSQGYHFFVILKEYYLQKMAFGEQPTALDDSNLSEPAVLSPDNGLIDMNQKEDNSGKVKKLGSLRNVEVYARKPQHQCPAYSSTFKQIKGDQKACPAECDKSEEGHIDAADSKEKNSDTLEKYVHEIDQYAVDNGKLEKGVQAGKSLEAIDEDISEYNPVKMYKEFSSQDTDNPNFSVAVSIDRKPETLVENITVTRPEENAYGKSIASTNIKTYIVGYNPKKKSKSLSLT